MQAGRKNTPLGRMNSDGRGGSVRPTPRGGELTHLREGDGDHLSRSLLPRQNQLRYSGGTSRSKFAGTCQAPHPPWAMLGLTQLFKYLTQKGSFSAVSKPIVTSRYSLESASRDLHNLPDEASCTTGNFKYEFRNRSKFCKILKIAKS